MTRAQTWLAVVLALTAWLVVQSAAADPPDPAPDTAEGVAAPPATVASRISYQGRLTDPSGAPLNGAYNMLYQFWTDSAAGGQVGADVVLNGVPVNDGLFTVQLDLPQAELYGQALWLAVQVNGQWLSPRQQLLPVPYALSLRPGARVEGISTTAVLTVTNTGLGTGLRAQGGVVGLDGVGSTGVRGTGDVGVKGEGPLGVHGNSTTGVGVRGSSSSGIGVQATNPGGLAIHATGQRGIEASGVVTGIVGIASDRGGRGVTGFGSNYSAIGVYGSAGFGTGVLGDGEIGVRGTSHLGSGVRGEGPTGVSGVSPSGYGVSGTSSSGGGVYGSSVSGRGVYGDSTSSFGVYGVSDSNYGVYGVSGSSRGVYGSGTTGVYGNSTTTGGYGLYTNDNLFVGGNCVGCKLALLALNVGEQPIAPGDVVVLAGMAPSPSATDPAPIIALRRADAAEGVAIGVANGRYIAAADGQLTDAAAAKGEFLVVVAQGMVKVKVDAGTAEVGIGDTLVLMGGRAQARKLDATTQAARTVAYALESARGGDSLIWALLLQR